MKRIVSVLLACILLFSCIPVFAATTTPEPQGSVYLSDNGNDQNSGAAADEAVKTFERAQEILGETGGVILIPDVYTYAGSFGYYMPYVQGASYIIRGDKADGSAQFVHGRRNIAMNNPLTFDNLTYTVTAGANSTLYANCQRLEFTETVTMSPYGGDSSNRSNYPVVYGGKDQAASANSSLVLNGGTFNYVIGGSAGAMTGSVSVSVGGTATILNRLYCGGGGDVAGGLTVDITGGTIAAELLLAGNAAGTVGGSTRVTVTGGSFSAIWCYGTNGATNTGEIRVDVSQYASALAAGWEGAHIRPSNTDTTVIGPVKATLAPAGMDPAGNLALRFSATVADGVVGEGQTLAMRFTQDGETVTVTDAVTENGSVIFILDTLSPQQMGDAVEAALVVLDSGGEVVETLAASGESSIRGAALSLLEQTAEELGMSEEKYAALRTLIADLLTYGAAAQDYRNYRTDSPVDAGLAALGLQASVWSELPADCRYTLSGSSNALYFTEAGFRFDNSNRLYFKFVSSAGTDSVRVTVNGAAVDAAELLPLGGNTYLVYSDAITASALTDTVEICLYADAAAGEPTQVLHYSAAAFAFRLQNDPTSAGALAKAFYLYCRSAKAFAMADAAA